MKVGIPPLHDHVSRALRTDMSGPEGERLVALALIDVYSDTLLDEQAARAAERGSNKTRPMPARATNTPGRADDIVLYES